MNFIQIAKNKNKIKSLSSIQKSLGENLKDYLYEYVCEEHIKYNDYKIGDIVFVHKYKYKDGTRGNNHIFLIIDSQIKNQNLLYFGMLISSKIEKIHFKSNKYIRKDKQNNLKKDSIIKTDVIYKIFTKNILLKIGNIDKTKVEIYKNYLLNNNN